ncbi:hypothetical protein PoB_004650700 [Plakobranchus ocellatus]|uniref:PiggyBac transposable element-derived protein domain-containing protein n=1 Tax=Plakobranchus ocellatus TaxID=259542 RepID=A0AAV4BL15_9GAST|nr:hypothetical protein PoB_004650700 [Plakobranchus ocellatus]
MQSPGFHCSVTLVTHSAPPSGPIATSLDHILNKHYITPQADQDILLLDQDSQQAVKVFDKLLQSSAHGHHLLEDRYYTSYSLLENLSQQKGHYFTGNCNANRGSLTQAMKMAKLAHKEIWHFVEANNKYLVTMFRDKKAKKPVIIA